MLYMMENFFQYEEIKKSFFSVNVFFQPYSFAHIAIKFTSLMFFN